MTFLGAIPSLEDKEAFEQWRRDAIVAELAQHADQAARAENWLCALFVGIIAIAGVPLAELVQWWSGAAATSASSPVLPMMQLLALFVVLVLTVRQWQQLQRDRASDLRLVAMLRNGEASARITA